MHPRVKLLFILALLVSQSAIAEERVISSLGRLEPENGVVRLAGPSGGGLTGAVMKSLEVAEGDWVESNQVVARLDSYNLRKAEVARLEAILTNARSEMARQQDLAKRSLTSAANLDTAQMNLDIALADLAAAKASLELAVVRSPLRAQVLEIHAYPGERVGPEGIMELGRHRSDVRGCRGLRNRHYEVEGRPACENPDDCNGHGADSARWNASPSKWGGLT